LSLRAWEGVFASLEAVMDPRVFRAMHPDWRITQREAVEGVCAAFRSADSVGEDSGGEESGGEDSDAARSDGEVWVALVQHQVAGFAALKFHTADRLGEIYMIAVDPAFQRRGIATALTRHAMDRFKQTGMTVAMVETGGDPGHAPARAAYESTGFRLLPIARYFKMV
jgi:ribosomal protein S18 acetylase RimI-like enzyme